MGKNALPKIAHVIAPSIMLHMTFKSCKAKGEPLVNFPLFIRKRNLSQSTQQTIPQVPKLGSCTHTPAAREAGKASLWCFQHQLWEMESASRKEVGDVGLTAR